MTPPNLSLIYIMVLFWLTFWLVKRFLVVPIGRVLDQRYAKIEGTQEHAATAEGDAVAATRRLEGELEDAARSATRIRSEHRERAQAARQERLDTVRADADRRLHAALKELDQEAAAAQEALRRSAQDLAREFAGRLVERELAS